jgi:hypothetical protein
VPKPQLFLDCDGVLADFTTYATGIFGEPPDQAEVQHGDEGFWSRLKAHGSFYRSLPLMADAMQLFNAVAHLNPVILTGCPDGGWAEPQKRAWRDQHFPAIEMICCKSRNKREHMSPGDILVDDLVKYRQLWLDAGGTFVHHLSAKDTIDALRELGLPVLGDVDSVGSDDHQL